MNRVTHKKFEFAQHVGSMNRVEIILILSSIMCAHQQQRHYVAICWGFSLMNVTEQVLISVLLSVSFPSQRNATMLNNTVRSRATCDNWSFQASFNITSHFSNNRARTFPRIKSASFIKEEFFNSKGSQNLIFEAIKRRRSGKRLWQMRLKLIV